MVCRGRRLPGPGRAQSDGRDCAAEDTETLPGRIPAPSERHRPPPCLHADPASAVADRPPVVHVDPVDTDLRRAALPTADDRDDIDTDVGRRSLHPRLDRQTAGTAPLRLCRRATGYQNQPGQPSLSAQSRLSE